MKDLYRRSRVAAVAAESKLTKNYLDRKMTKKNILKTGSYLFLIVFAIGVLLLSFRAVRVDAKSIPPEKRLMTGHMLSSLLLHINSAKFSSQDEKEMVTLMKLHLGENFQDHHLQMHS